MARGDEAYRDFLRSAMDKLGVLADKRARTMFSVIADMRDEVIDIMRDDTADAWDLAQLERTRAGLDGLSNSLRRRLEQEVVAHNQDAARLGFNMQPQALQRAGVSVSFGEPDTRQVDLATQYSADLIRSITDEARTDINQAMLRSVIARDTPSQTIAAISDILRTQPDRMTGRFGPLASQADRVLRTEGLTIANLANYTRMRETASRFPGAGKVWLHGGGGRTPRPWHRDVLNGKVIPFDEDFIVKDAGHTQKAFGPHDPRLGPWSVINCTCTLGIVLP